MTWTKCAGCGWRDRCWFKPSQYQCTENVTRAPARCTSTESGREEPHLHLATHPRVPAP